jgi:hypothetical protein
MSTSTPATTLLVNHIVAQVQTISQPTYRTDIGLNASSERPQVTDDAAPLVSVRLTGWEVTGEGLQIERDCSVLIEASVPATDETSEDGARLAAEDLWELFRRPAREIQLQADPFIGALISVAESATIERPDGARAITVSLTLSAVLREVVPLPVPEEV